MRALASRFFGRILRANGARVLLAWGLGLGVSACRGDIPEGVYACDTNDDCPSGFVCRPEGDDPGLYCYASESSHDAGGMRDDAGGSVDSGPTDAGKQLGSDAGVDGGDSAVPPESAPARPSTGSWSGGERRGAAGYVLYDDGFDRSQRLCNAGGTTCVTGEFSP